MNAPRTTYMYIQVTVIIVTGDDNEYLSEIIAKTVHANHVNHRQQNSTEHVNATENIM